MRSKSQTQSSEGHTRGVDIKERDNETVTIGSNLTRHGNTRASSRSLKEEKAKRPHYSPRDTPAPIGQGIACPRMESSKMVLRAGA